MKIRTGFVSNSSSSSFVVAFDEIPESAYDLQELLFGDAREWECYDEKVPTKTLAQIVWRDIQGQLHKLPYSLEDIAEDMHNLVYWKMFYIEEEIPELPGCFTSKQYRKHYWEEYKEKGPERDAARKEEERELSARQEEAAREFLEANKGKVILRFDYSDNDGTVFSTLEHGGIFQNLPHKQISNH